MCNCNCGSVPLVSRVCPSDVCRIWKSGASLRVDATLLGFENMTWIRGRRSYIFRGDGTFTWPGQPGASHILVSVCVCMSLCVCFMSERRGGITEQGTSHHCPQPDLSLSRSLCVFFSLSLCLSVVVPCGRHVYRVDGGEP